MLDELVDSGIPVSRLKHNRAVWSTLDQLVWVRARFGQTSDAHVAIVASRLQAPRIAALCREARLDDVTLVPSPIDREPPTSGIPLFVPTEFALRVSRDALYEHAALVYHRN
jgi:vancomycin permeability regulator SanA